MENNDLYFRYAERKDVALILKFIKNLAEYEKMLNEVVATEEIFIMPKYRGKGYGKQTFKKLAQIAIERKCGRLEWVCLDWNKPSIDFYLSINAKPMDDWTIYRLEGATLDKMAE